MHSCAARRSSTQHTGTAYVEADCQLYSLPPPSANDAALHAVSFTAYATTDCQLYSPLDRRTAPPRGRPHRSGTYALMCRPRDVHHTTMQRIYISCINAGRGPPNRSAASQLGPGRSCTNVPRGEGERYAPSELLGGCAWRAASPEVPASPRRGDGRPPLGAR